MKKNNQIHEKVKMKIKKGDNVIVISGKDKGKSGEVLKVFPKLNKVLVSKVNVVTKHQRPTSYTSAGGKIEKEMPIHACKVAFLDPESNKPTKIGFKFDDDGVKYRYAKRSEKKID